MREAAQSGMSPGLLIATPLQRGAFVLPGFLLVTGAALTHWLASGPRGLSQHRMVRIRSSVNLAAVVEHRQAQLDVIKFGGVYDVLGLRRQDLLDLSLCRLNPVVSEGMGRK